MTSTTITYRAAAATLWQLRPEMVVHGGMHQLVCRPQRMREYWITAVCSRCKLLGT